MTRAATECLRDILTQAGKAVAIVTAAMLLLKLRPVRHLSWWVIAAPPLFLAAMAVLFALLIGGIALLTGWEDS